MFISRLFSILISIILCLYLFRRDSGQNVQVKELAQFGFGNDW